MLKLLYKRISINLTPECVSQVKKICKQNEALRILVEAGSGCGGFSYKFEIVNEVLEDDKVFQQEEAKVIIDPESARLMDGAVVHYTKEMIKRAFVVQNNPLAEMTCGCGTSFSPKSLKFK